MRASPHERLVAGVVAILAVASAARAGVVEVVHWSNSHLVRTGSGLRPLEQTAAEFTSPGT